MDKIIKFNKHMAFNRNIGPGKKYKINKSRAYVYSGLSKDLSMKFLRKNSRIGGFENLSFFECAILIFFSSFPWKSVKVYWLARMGQNFDQAKRDNTFWPRPNILHPSVYVPTWNRKTTWCTGGAVKQSWVNWKVGPIYGRDLMRLDLG